MVTVSSCPTYPVTWQAAVKHNNTSHGCGIFADEVHAARAYDLKALELKGPAAAVTNFPASQVSVRSSTSESNVLVRMRSEKLSWY